MTTVASDFAAIFGGRVATAVLSVVSVVLTTHLLGPTQYGHLAYVRVIATLIAYNGSSWTSSAVLRFGRQSLDQTGDMRAVNWERFLITTPPLLLAGGVCYLLRAFGVISTGLGWSLVTLAVVYGFVYSLSNHVIFALQASGRMRASAWSEVVRLGIVVCAMGVFALAGAHFSAALVADVTIVGWLITAAFFASRIWRSAFWPPKLDRNLRKKILVFSLPLVAYSASQYVISSVDVLIIGMFRSDATVGVYSLAYQAFGVFVNITQTSNAVLTPLFVSLRGAGRGEALTRFTERIIPQISFVACSTIGIFAPLANVVVVAIFGSAFRGAAPSLIILSIATAFIVTTNLLAPVMLVHDQTRMMGRIAAVAAIVNVVGDVILIGPAGLGGNGAAVATALAMFAIMAGYAYRVRHVLDVHLPARRLVVLVPLAAGTTLGLIGGRWQIACLEVCGTALIALVVGRLCVFRRSDAMLVDSLNLPPSLRRVLSWAIVTIGRP